MRLEFLLTSPVRARLTQSTLQVLVPRNQLQRTIHARHVYDSGTPENLCVPRSVLLPKQRAACPARVSSPNRGKHMLGMRLDLPRNSPLLLSLVLHSAPRTSVSVVWPTSDHPQDQGRGGNHGAGSVLSLAEQLPRVYSYKCHLRVHRVYYSVDPEVALTHFGHTNEIYFFGLLAQKKRTSN